MVRLSDRSMYQEAEELRKIIGRRTFFYWFGVWKRGGISITLICRHIGRRGGWPIYRKEGQRWQSDKLLIEV